MPPWSPVGPLSPAVGQVPQPSLGSKFFPVNTTQSNVQMQQQQQYSKYQQRQQQQQQQQQQQVVSSDVECKPESHCTW